MNTICPRCNGKLKTGYCWNCDYDDIVKQRRSISYGSAIDINIARSNITDYEARKFTRKDLTKRNIKESISFIHDLEPEDKGKNWRDFESG